MLAVSTSKEVLYDTMTSTGDVEGKYDSFMFHLCALMKSSKSISLNFIYISNRSASVLCTGLEEFHHQLRARACCELVLHQDYYLTPDKLDVLKWEDEEQCKSHKPVGKNAIVASSANYEKGAQMNRNSVTNMVFELDCIENQILESTQTCVTYIVYALSSVLKSSLHCVYPEVNLRIHNAFHKLIVPHEHCSTPLTHDLIIMWTRAAISDPKSTTSTPNHFVPCIRYTQNNPSNALQNTVEGSIVLKQQYSTQVSQNLCILLPEDCKTNVHCKAKKA